MKRWKRHLDPRDEVVDPAVCHQPPQPVVLRPLPLPGQGGQRARVDTNYTVTQLHVISEMGLIINLMKHLLFTATLCLVMNLTKQA